METVWLNDWAKENYRKKSELDALILDFDIAGSELNGVNILLASYTYEEYEGKAFVLFEKDGKLYEVNGWHCSCYGLEGQWKPEETSVKELRFRLEKGTFGRDSWSNENRFAAELFDVLEILAKKGLSDGKSTN